MGNQLGALELLLKGLGPAREVPGEEISWIEQLMMEIIRSWRFCFGAKESSIPDFDEIEAASSQNHLSILTLLVDHFITVSNISEETLSNRSVLEEVGNVLL